MRDRCGVNAILCTIVFMCDFCVYVYDRDDREEGDGTTGRRGSTYKGTHGVMRCVD